MTRKGCSHLKNDRLIKAMVAEYIDHTNLLPQATARDIETLCAEAVRYNFHAVCVNPCRVALAARKLMSQDVCVCTVVGFPLGASGIGMKLLEAKNALNCGADEVDMVLNIGWLKEGRDNDVMREIKAVVDVARERTNASTRKKIVKVIIETCSLDDDEKIRACMLAKQAGADYVKTSTGLGNSGATVHDIALMRRVVGDIMGIKASGGIRTAAQVLAMINAGATRIGTSSGIKIMEEWK